MAKLDGSIITKTLGRIDTQAVRIGHPSGIITMIPTIIGGEIKGVASQRTARRIMDGTLYIRN